MESKRITIICIILAAIILLTIGFKFLSERLDTTQYEPIRIYDPEPGKLNFVPNEVIIGFIEDSEEEEIKNVLDNINNLESYESLLNKSYVVRLTYDFGSRGELNTFCGILKNSSPIISYCEPNNIIKLDDCSKGPC